MSENGQKHCPRCGQILRPSVAEGQCVGCLIQLALNQSEDSLREVEDADVFLRNGEDFGDYRLHEEIARGGMGVVYRATQFSLNREVAVKMILGGQLATRESVQRFRIEAEAAAKLNHPGIVPIYEIGEHESQHYFAMRFIEGIDLGRSLKDHLLSNDPASSPRIAQVRIARLIGRVTRALAFAHEHGVLHRDIKPTNILIDREGNPYVTDFGLAKLIGYEENDLTLTSTLVGSPSYMAPEQATAGRRKITTAADVYGIGAVLYELLTGHPPFEGKTALDTVRLVMDRPPVRPSQHNPQVHPDLETITLKCLEKEPARRYATANDLADDLQRFADGQAIKARPVGRAEQLLLWARRNPVPATLSIGLLLALILGLVGVGWQANKTRIANETLSNTVRRLKIERVDRLLDQDQEARALAQVAQLIREGTNDWRSAMLAMSIMEQRQFVVPGASPIRFPKEDAVIDAQTQPGGRLLAVMSSHGWIRFYDSLDGSQHGRPLESDEGFRSFAFDKRGKRLIALSAENRVAVWELETRDRLWKPFSTEQKIDAVQFLGDGEFFMTVSSSTVQIHTTADGKLLHKLDHGHRIRDAMPSAVGTRLMTASRNNANAPIRIWNWQSGELETSLKPGRIFSACLNREGTCVAWVSRKTLEIWSLESDSSVATFDGLTRTGERPLAFSPDGNILAVGSFRAIQLYDLVTQKPIGQIEHDYNIEDYVFSPDSRWIVTASGDSTARLWDAHTGKPASASMGHASRVARVQWSNHHEPPKLMTFAAPFRYARHRPAVLRVWTIQPRKLPADRSYEHNAHDGVGWTSDERLLVSNNIRNQLFFKDRHTGEIVGQPFQAAGPVWGAFIVENDKKLITVSSNASVSMWSIPDGKPLIDPIKVPASVHPSDISPDQQLFAIGMTNHVVQVRSTADGRLLLEYEHDDELNSVMFSPDSRRIVSGSSDNTVMIRNIETGELLTHFTAHRDQVTWAEFDRTGEYVLSSSHDGTARVWNSHTGHELLPPLKHRSEVLHAELSPDGRLIATASRDRTVGVWDVKTGKLRYAFLQHPGAVRNVRFSPDGRLLLTIAFDGPRIWDVDNGVPLTVRFDQTVRVGTGFQDKSGMGRFMKDGRSFMLATDSSQLLIWEVPIPPHEVPDWFAGFVESVAGVRIAAEIDVPELVAAEEYLSLRQTILELPTSDDYVRWAQSWIKGESGPNGPTQEALQR